MSFHKLRVNLADEAIDDIESITIHGTGNWGELHADRYYAELADALDSLATFPRLGRTTSDRPRELRSLGVGHHRIHYRIEPDAIYVLRILHERMDATHLLDR